MKTREMMDKAEDVKETARDWKNLATEKARAATTAADTYVRENTWMTIGIVAAAACLVGFMIGRSSKTDLEDLAS